MNRCLARLAATVTAFLTLGAMAQDRPATESAVLATYVVLGEGSAGDMVALARVILPLDHACPSIAGAAPSLPMTPRDNPHGFTVKVCEALIPQGGVSAIRLEDGEIRLPTIPTRPARIVMTGDTGCKLSHGGDDPASCQADAVAQPFADLAAAAAARAPDLVLHVGDYNYRGTPGRVRTGGDGGQSTAVGWVYDAGDHTNKRAHCDQDADAGYVSQNAPGSGATDVWERWRDDFFVPARPLLERAPWIVTRGNHELCSRAGPGWFYFLDPGSNLPQAGGPQRHCPTDVESTDPLAHEIFRRPYRVSIGDFHVVVLDSSNACGGFRNDRVVKRYVTLLEEIAAFTPKPGSAWLMTHRPPWGIQRLDEKRLGACGTSREYGCINRTLQSAIRGTTRGRLPDDIDLIVSGHMHRFQAVTFTEGHRPPQLIVGNGGVDLAESPAVEAQGVHVDGLTAHVLSTGETVSHAGDRISAYGFMIVHLAAGGDWKGELVNPLVGVTIAHCGDSKKHEPQVCKFGEQISP